MTAIDYTIYEFSQPPKPQSPVLENPTQLNKDRSTEDLLSTAVSSTYSIPFQKEAAAPPKQKENGYTNMDAIRVYGKVINDNIEYPYLIQNKSVDKGMLDEIVSLMLETVCTRRKVIRIAGDDYPTVSFLCFFYCPYQTVPSIPTDVFIFDLFPSF